MDTQFLKLLVCPLCNSPLQHDQTRQELICKHDQLAYPIRNGIPVMLKEEARALDQNAGTPQAAPQSQDNTSTDGATAQPNEQTESEQSGPGSSDSKH